jgi:hypothetical protein
MMLQELNGSVHESTTTPIFAIDYSSTFLYLLPDQHPTKSIINFIGLLNIVRLNPHLELMALHLFMNNCCSPIPNFEDYSDFGNLKMPFRDFKLHTTFALDNMVDMEHEAGTLYCWIEPHLLKEGYHNFIRAVDYRHSLLLYVYRLAAFDNDTTEPFFLTETLFLIRERFSEGFNFFEILALEIKVLELFASFPQSIDAIAVLLIHQQQGDILQPLAHAIISERMIEAFPCYRVFDRCNFIIMQSEEAPMDDWEHELNYLTDSEFETLNGLFLPTVFTDSEPDDMSYYTDSDDDYIAHTTYPSSSSFRVDNISGWGTHPGYDSFYLPEDNDYTSKYSAYFEFDIFEYDLSSSFDQLFKQDVWFPTGTFVVNLLKSLLESNAAVPQMHMPFVTDFTNSLHQVRDSIDDFSDKIPNQTERDDWKKVFEKIGSSLDSTSGLFSTVSTLTSMLPGAETAKNATDKMREALKGVSSKEQSDTLFMCMLASFMYYLRYKTWTGVSLFATFWLPLCVTDPQMFKTTIFVWIYICSNLPTSLDEEEKAEPQISTDQFENGVEVVSSLFLGYLSLEKSKDTSTAITSFLRDFSRMKGGVVEVTKITFKFIEGLINTTLQTINDKNPVFRFFSTNNDLYDEYFAEVRTFCSKFNNHQIHASAETLCRVASLIESGRKIRSGLPRDKSSQDILDFLKQDLQSLSKVQIALEHQNISFTGFRQEPAVIEFKGPTAIAKSVVQTNANYAAVARHFQGKELQNFVLQPSTKVYTCIPENEYLDSFKQSHWVVNIDDFGQSRDVVGNPDNEYMKLLRFVNGFEYYPHMAGIEEKGTVSFKAPYIVLSSNVQHHNPVSMAEPRALRRRIHFSYLVTPRIEYTLDSTLSLDLWHRAMDPNKVPKDYDGETVIDDTYHDFYVLDQDTSQPTGEIIDFATVMQRWFDLYDRNKKFFEKNIKTFEKTVEKYSNLYHPDLGIDDEDCCMEEIVNDGSILHFGEGSFQQSIFRYKNHIRARALLNYYCPDSVIYSTEEFYNSLAYMEIALLEQGITEDIFKLKIKDHTQSLVPIVSAVKYRKKVSILSKMHTYIVTKFPQLLRLKTYLIENGGTIVIRIILIIIAAGIGRLIQKLLIKLFCSREYYDEVYPQSHNEGDKMRTSKQPQKIYNNAKVMKAFVLSNGATTPQMGCDNNGQDILRSITNSNHFSIAKKNVVDYVDNDGVTREKTEWNHLGYFLMLRERTALMPFHYIMTFAHGIEDDPLRLSCILRLTRNSKSKSPVYYYVTVADILANYESHYMENDEQIDNPLIAKDLVLVNLPDKVQPCRDITEYIVRNKTLSRDSNNIEGLLINGDNSFFCHASYRDTPYPVFDKDKNEGWYMREYYKYHATTVTGDCGSIFGKMDATVQKEKIYGIHVSGSQHSNYGFAIAFTREEIQSELDRFYPLILPAEPQICEFLDNMNFKVDGPIANPPILPTKSNICKSPIWSVVKDSTTRPCKLFEFPTGGGDTIDPWEVAISAYDVKPPPISGLIHNQVQRAANQYFYMLSDTMIKRYEPRVFTLTEAIHGVEGDEHFGPIPSSTSAGYPMNVQGEINLKKLLFENDRDSDEYRHAFEAAQEAINLAILTYLSGERPEFFYVDYLKDERKKLDKVLIGKTRMFSGGPLILYFLFRMYFGWFDSHYKSNKITNWSAIGVNPFSMDWEHISRFLSEVTNRAKQFGAGDYKGFDTKHLPFIHMIIVLLINKVYYPNATIHENQMRIALFQEIYHSNHLFRGIIVRWFHGMPSGNALTAILNTIYNAICLCFVFMCIKDEYSELNLSDEDCIKLVRAIILGDDNAFSVDEILMPYYNELTLPGYLSRIGMVYTTEFKETATNPFREITEITFLKRMWAFDPLCGRHIAPLELDVVLEMSMWTKKGTDYLNIAITNFENTLNELSLHPYETWEKFYPTLLIAARREYEGASWVLPLLTPWDVRRQRVLETISVY